MNKAQSGKASGMSLGRLFRAVWTGVVPRSVHKFRGARLASPFAPTGLAPGGARLLHYTGTPLPTPRPHRAGPGGAPLLHYTRTPLPTPRPRRACPGEARIGDSPP